MEKYALLGVLFIGFVLTFSGCAGKQPVPPVPAADANESDWAASPEGFDECAAAGNPVMESYPRQCRMPDGKVFTEEIDEPVKPPTPPDETHELIGGQRDEYGCLGPAGYSFNESVNACVREWELDESQKKAARIAVKHIGAQKGLTIFSVEVFRCPGCFAVELEKYGAAAKISLQNWTIAEETKFEEPDSKEDFCGTSTEGPCKTDADCITAGCSGQICQSKDEESMMTTCEFRDCYRASDYGLGCRCTEEKCSWA